MTTAKYLSERMPLTAMNAAMTARQFGGESDKKGTEFTTSDSLQAMPLMLAQHLRNMDEGFSVLFSHKTKGPVRTFFEWEKPGLEDVYVLDPSRDPAT